MLTSKAGLIRGLEDRSAAEHSVQDSFPGYSREIYTLGELARSCGSLSLEADPGPSPIHVCPRFRTRYAPLFLVRIYLTRLSFKGPLLWAPAGEVSGRRTLYILTFALFTLFNGVCCASQNLTTLIVMRLLSGISGAAPLSNSGESRFPEKIWGGIAQPG